MSLVLEIDVWAEDIIKGLGEATSKIITEIDDVLEDYLLDIKYFLIENPPAGFPSDVNLEENINVSVNSGRGEISVDTRQKTKKDLNDPATQEEKNVAYFLEYGTKTQPARPFLRPLIDENIKTLEKKIFNAVTKNLSDIISEQKARGSELYSVGDIKAARSAWGSAGGLTTALNKIKSTYGESL